jgi:cytoskeleton protein RodZ
MSADRAAGDFGSKLREARERRGISLRQIANATKISISVLEALERNDISRLPGGIFSRGFVRSYAVEVGLDPEATIQDFITQFPHDSVTAGHPTSQRVEDNEALESNRRMASTLLRLIAISVPIVGVVMYVGIAERRAPPRAASEPVAVTTPAPAAATPPVTPPAAPVLPASPTSPAPEIPPAAPAQSVAAPPPASPAAAAGVELAATDRLTVRLSATRSCWVSVTVDGQKTIQWLLQAGEQQTVEVLREIVLTAGDAAALTMTLNGAAAKPLGRSGQVVTARFTLRNFKEYLSAQ